MNDTTDRPRQNPRSPARRETVQILLTPSLHAELRARAAASNETVSALGARLLEAGLESPLSADGGRDLSDALAQVKNLASALKALAATLDSQVASAPKTP